MNRFVFLMTMCLMSVPAFGQDLCGVIKPQAGAQNGANYVPGVDVHGKSVVSADLNAAPIDLSVVNIPIEVELIERFGLDVPAAAGLDLEPIIGHLAVHQDGRVLFGGRDVSAQVIAACKSGVMPEALSKDHGQMAPKPLEKPKAPLVNIDGQYPNKETQ